MGPALGSGEGLRIVVHWATWCSGCIEEMPELHRLHAALGERVQFFGISWDRFQASGTIEDSQRAIRQQMVKHSLQWPTLLLSDAVRPESFFRELEMECQTVPQTWLIDNSGAIIERVTIALTKETTDDLIARVGALA